MSVSKHILEEAHFALLQSGQIALCDQNKKGELRIHRYVSREEILNLVKAMYIQFRHDNPDKQVIQLPFGEESFLAIAEIPAKKQG